MVRKSQVNSPASESTLSFRSSSTCATFWLNKGQNIKNRCEDIEAINDGGVNEPQPPIQMRG